MQALVSLLPLSSWGTWESGDEPDFKEEDSKAKTDCSQMFQMLPRRGAGGKNVERTKPGGEVREGFSEEVIFS